MKKCERCVGGDGEPQGEVCVIYPWTPYPQSQETGTIETCPECGGTKWVPDDYVFETDCED